MLTIVIEIVIMIIMIKITIITVILLLLLLLSLLSLLLSLLSSSLVSPLFLLLLLPSTKFLSLALSTWSQFFTHAITVTTRFTHTHARTQKTKYELSFGNKREKYSPFLTWNALNAAVRTPTTTRQRTHPHTHARTHARTQAGTHTPALDQNQENSQGTKKQGQEG